MAGSRSDPSVATTGWVLQDPPTEHRGIAFIVLLVSLLPLVIGWALRPDPAGVGTHEQLGFPACTFLRVTGYPCVSCGMTTAVALAAHGQLAQAFQIQPAGALLALVLASASLVAGWCLVTGASLRFIARRLWQWPVLLIVVLVLLGAWLYKVLVMTMDKA